jgi:hypothetical protein
MNLLADGFVWVIRGKPFDGITPDWAWAVASKQSDVVNHIALATAWFLVDV